MLTGLPYIRKILNISLNDLAEKLDVSKQTVNKWEKGVLNITPKRLNQLEEVLHIPRMMFYNETFDRDDDFQIELAKLKIANDERKKEIDDSIIISADYYNIKILEDLFNNMSSLLEENQSFNVAFLVSALHELINISRAESKLIPIINEMVMIFEECLHGKDELDTDDEDEEIELEEDEELKAQLIEYRAVQKCLFEDFQKLIKLSFVIKNNDEN